MSIIPILSWILAASVRASLLVLVILLLQRLLRSRLSAKWKYALWTPVLAAILIPAQPLLPNWEWPIANESHTTSRVDTAPMAPEIDLGSEQQSMPPDTNLAAVQPVDEVVASELDIASLTPANPAARAPAGGDAEIAFRDVGETELSRSVASSQQTRDWWTILAAGWLLGAVCLGVVVWVSYASTLRRVRRRAISVDQVDLARVRSLAKEIGLRGPPQVWLSPEVKAPAVCGVLRPMLLLNESFFQMLSREESDFVLRHELMHIRRGDLLLNTLLFGLLSLHWFNPLLWYAFFRAGADREAACDEDVLHAESPARRVAYGKTLLRMETELPQSGLCLGFVGMVQKGKRIRERIQFISNPKRMRLSVKSLALLCMCVTAILGIAKSAEPQSKPQTQPATLAKEEPETEEAKGEKQQREISLKFQKVASLESPGEDLSLARVSVSLDQNAVLARVQTGDQDTRLSRVRTRRYDVVLQDLNAKSPRRTSLGDHYFGFVPKSNLAFEVSWGTGVRFWNTRTHTPSGDYMPHALREDTTILPAVSPDGKVMVTRSQLDHLQFWNIETRQPITEEIKQPGMVSSMRFSADGKWFFSRARGGLSIRDPRTGDLVVADIRHDASGYAYLSASKQLLTVQNDHDDESGWHSELVIRGGKAFAERRRIEMDGQAQKAAWIDKSHILVVGRNPDLRSNERETLYVVTLSDNKTDVRTLLHYNWIREAVVAPDRTHFVVRTREETSCWKVGDREPVWTQTGDHLVSFGDRDWVLFHNGPAVAYSLADGSELWRGEDVRLCKVFGSKIWVCNDKEMEIWQVEPDAQPEKPAANPVPPQHNSRTLTNRSHAAYRLLKDEDGEVRTAEFFNKARIRRLIDGGKAGKEEFSSAQQLHQLSHLKRLVVGYGSELTTDDLESLSRLPGIVEMEFGVPSLASEYVTIEGDLLPLGQLKTLEVVRLCKDGIHDDDLRFVAELPRLHTLEFRADNGRADRPMCTDKCVEYLCKAQQLRRLSIAGGQFTDDFVETLVRRLPRLETLLLNSNAFTDESLRSIAKHGHNLRELSIASKQFTEQGRKALDALPKLRSASSAKRATERKSNEDEKTPQANATNAEIISISTVGPRAELQTDTDIVRYKGHFFMAFAKPTRERQNAIHILQSADGRDWKLATTLRSEIEERRPDVTHSTHYSGRPVWFSTMPSGRLCVTGRASEKTIVWSTDDGADWREELDIKLSRSYSRIHWQNDRAYCVSDESSSCGEKFELFRLESAGEDSAPKTVYELSHNSHTLTGPRESQLVVTKDRAFCMLSFKTYNFDKVRRWLIPSGKYATGSIGVSKAPYTEWTWTQTNLKFGHPNLLVLKDASIVSSVFIEGDEAHSALCQIDPSTGKLTELLRFPTGGIRQPVGMAEYDGHIWASFYDGPREGEKPVMLKVAKIKLVRK